MTPGPATAGPGEPVTTPAPDASGATGDTEPISIVPGMAPAPEEPGSLPPVRAGWPAPLAEVAALARKNPLEAVCVLFIGVGGLFLPFPLWLVGGLGALRSRRWDKRDRWIALVGPLAVAVACLLIAAGTGSGSYFVALGHDVRHQFGLLLRVGCLVCAGYLLWRLRRGPRARKVPPWLRLR
jgi:hypothetical protein